MLHTVSNLKSTVMTIYLYRTLYETNCKFSMLVSFGYMQNCNSLHLQFFFSLFECNFLLGLQTTNGIKILHNISYVKFGPLLDHRLLYYLKLLNEVLRLLRFCFILFYLITIYFS